MQNLYNRLSNYFVVSFFEVCSQGLGTETVGWVLAGEHSFIVFQPLWSTQLSHGKVSTAILTIDVTR